MKLVKKVVKKVSAYTAKIPMTKAKSVRALNPLAKMPAKDMGNCMLKCDESHPNYKVGFGVLGDKRGKTELDRE